MHSDAIGKFLSKLLSDLDAERYDEPELGDIDFEALHTLEEASAYPQWIYQFQVCYPDIRSLSN